MNPMHNPACYSLLMADRLGLGALLLLALFDRLKCGICGPNPVPPRPLKLAAQVIDPGYCLDAPESMPAGGMGTFRLQGMDEALPEQLMCEREWQ